MKRAGLTPQTRHGSNTRFIFPSYRRWVLWDWRDRIQHRSGSGGHELVFQEVWTIGVGQSRGWEMNGDHESAAMTMRRKRGKAQGGQGGPGGRGTTKVSAAAIAG
jgi:hypothetical protein